MYLFNKGRKIFSSVTLAVIVTFSVTVLSIVGLPQSVRSSFLGIDIPYVEGWQFDPLCNPVFMICAKLDSEGKMPTGPSYCEYKCPLTKVAFEKHMWGETFYEFGGESSYQAHGLMACPPGIKKIKGAASWKPGWDKEKGFGGIATEDIYLEQPFVEGGWARIILTRSWCKSNPWLVETTDCTLIDKVPVQSKFPEPFPRSAAGVTQAMRHDLLLTELLKTPPEIQSPGNNDVIKDGKAVFTARKTLPSTVEEETVRVEVEFNRSLWPGSEPIQPMKIKETMPLNNGFAIKAISLNEGLWQCRTRLVAQNGPGIWSKIISVKVPAQDTTKDLKINKKLKIIPTNVTKPVLPPKKD